MLSKKHFQKLAQQIEKIIICLFQTNTWENYHTRLNNNFNFLLIFFFKKPPTASTSIVCLILLWFDVLLSVWFVWIFKDRIKSIVFPFCVKNISDNSPYCVYKIKCQRSEWGSWISLNMRSNWKRLLWQMELPMRFCTSHLFQHLDRSTYIFK